MLTNELLIEYVLQSEQNLRIATRVSKAYDPIRIHLITEFSNRLADDVKRTLEDVARDRQWTVTNQLVTGEKNPNLWVTNPSWHGRYSILLESTAGVTLSALRFGIGLDKEDADKLPALIAEMRSVCGGGASRTGWLWATEPPNHFDDWTNENTLADFLQLKLGGPSKALDWFHDRFVDTAKHLDEHLQRALPAGGRPLGS